MTLAGTCPKDGYRPVDQPQIAEIPARRPHHLECPSGPSPNPRVVGVSGCTGGGAPSPGRGIPFSGQGGRQNRVGERGDGVQHVLEGLREPIGQVVP